MDKWRKNGGEKPRLISFDQNPAMTHPRKYVGAARGILKKKEEKPNHFSSRRVTINANCEGLRASAAK